MLDMTMPEQGGRETLVALRAAGADVPVILSSGYSANEASAQFEGAQGVVARINFKPVRRI
jgi:CheY-like chemotaxis protein